MSKIAYVAPAVKVVNVCLSTFITSSGSALSSDGSSIYVDDYEEGSVDEAV